MCVKSQDSQNKEGTPGKHWLLTEVPLYCPGVKRKQTSGFQAASRSFLYLSPTQLLFWNVSKKEEILPFLHYTQNLYPTSGSYITAMTRTGQDSAHKTLLLLFLGPLMQVSPWALAVKLNKQEMGVVRILDPPVHQQRRESAELLPEAFSA